MVEKYGLMKGDHLYFKADAEDILNVPIMRLQSFCDAMICKVLEECEMDDEQIKEASDRLHEKFYEIAESEESEQNEMIADLLEWRWMHGFEEEKEK